MYMYLCVFILFLWVLVLYCNFLEILALSLAPKICRHSPLFSFARLYWFYLLKGKDKRGELKTIEGWWCLITIIIMMMVMRTKPRVCLKLLILYMYIYMVLNMSKKNLECIGMDGSFFNIIFVLLEFLYFPHPLAILDFL